MFPLSPISATEDEIQMGYPVWVADLCQNERPAPPLDSLCLCPLGDFMALLITESTNDYHDKVYERPNSQATRSDKLQYPRAYLPHIKPMETEASKKETEKKCRQDSFAAHSSLLLKWGVESALDS